MEEFSLPHHRFKSTINYLTFTSLASFTLTAGATLAIPIAASHRYLAINIAIISLIISILAYAILISIFIVDGLQCLTLKKSKLCDEVEATMSREQGVIDMLVEKGSLLDIQRYDRRLAFELKIIDQRKAGIAILAGLAAAAIALAPSLPLGGLSISEALKAGVPALLFGAGIAGIQQHDFGLRLHRVNFAFSEAERLLRSREANSAAPAPTGIMLPTAAPRMAAEAPTPSKGTPQAAAPGRSG